MKERGQIFGFDKRVAMKKICQVKLTSISVKNETDEIRLGKNKRGLIAAALTRTSAKDRNVPACPSPSQYPCAASEFVNVKQ